MNKDIAVSIKNVSKKFHLPEDNYGSIKMKFLSSRRGHAKRNEYEAIKDIDLDIKNGEFIGILGRNGAGKSSLLKMIAGIYQPTTGSISVNGRLVPFIELGVGFNKNLTGRDNVYLNGAMLGFTREEIDKMYDSIVDFAELHKFMNQKLRNYSSGMKVRLAFSIAIKADADILLLDEVLAVGDAAFKRKCYEYFNQLKERKKTIIFVTHNMAAVSDYCDRAVVLEAGRVAFDGKPLEAVENYFQLFSPQQDNGQKEKKVVIDDVSVKVEGDKITFEIDASNKTDKIIEDVVVRVAVKKQNGRAVAGFDNKNIEVPYEIDFSPTESKHLVFESLNILGSGSYSVNVSLRASAGDSFTGEDDEDDNNLSEFYDSSLNAAHFTIKKDGSNAPIILPAKVGNKES